MYLLSEYACGWVVVCSSNVCLALTGVGHPLTSFCKQALYGVKQILFHVNKYEFLSERSGQLCIHGVSRDAQGR